MGILFESGIEYAVLCVVLMVLLGLVVRVGTDEIAPIFENAAKAVQRGNATPDVVFQKRDLRSSEMCVIFLGVLAFLGATALMVLVLVDMAWASYDIPESTALRSFFFVWIGYPIVALISIIARQFTPPEGANGYDEWLSFFKDVSYAALDVYSKGIFALWTAYSAFNVPLAGSIPDSHPFVWPPPPSAPPPLVA